MPQTWHPGEATPAMTHEQLVLEALAYRRNLGASPSDIRAYLSYREKTKHRKRQDLAVLRRLEGKGQIVNVGEKWFFTPAGNKLAKGSALDAEWQSADAWILLAALYCGPSGEIELRHLIAAADFINHAIPTLEEMHGAINRLLAGRMITAKRGTFSVTDKARELFAKVEASCKKFVQDQREGLGRIMDCPCCGVKLKRVRWRFALDAATYKEAVESYYAMAR